MSSSSTTRECSCFLTGPSKQSQPVDSLFRIGHALSRTCPSHRSTMSETSFLSTKGRFFPEWSPFFQTQSSDGERACSRRLLLLRIQSLELKGPCGTKILASRVSTTTRGWSSELE